MSAELEVIKTELAAIGEAVKGLHDPDVIKSAIAEVLEAQAKTPEATKGREAAIAEANDKELDAKPVKAAKDFLRRPAANVDEKRAQKAADLLTIASAVARTSPEPVNIKATAAFGEYAAACKAIDLTDWADFVPTSFSTNLIDDVRMNLRVAALFPSLSLDRSPYQFPVRVSPTSRGYKLSESTTDTAAKIKTHDPADTKLTFTAAYHGARVLASYEILQDSTVGPLEYTYEYLSRVLAEDIEDMLLNGDADGSHMDSAVTAADDVRTMVNGLRRHAIAGSDTYDTAETSGGTAAFEEGDVHRTLAKMGKYGLVPSETPLITSVSAYYKMLVASTWPSFASVEKLGSQAVNVTGQLGQVFGRAVIVSPKVSVTLHTDGTDTGAGSTSGLIIPHLPSFRLAMFQNALIESQRIINTRQVEVVASEGIDFQALYASTEPTVGYGIKVAI